MNVFTMYLPKGSVYIELVQGFCTHGLPDDRCRCVSLLYVDPRSVGSVLKMRMPKGVKQVLGFWPG